DSLGTAAGMEGVRFHPDYFLGDEFGVAASIDVVYLRDAVRYLSYDCPPEDLGVTAGLISVDLRSVLRNYTCPPELLQLTAELNNINLRVALIVYNNWIPESLELTANITGVYLR